MFLRGTCFGDWFLPKKLSIITNNDGQESFVWLSFSLKLLLNVNVQNIKNYLVKHVGMNEDFPDNIVNKIAERFSCS